jgi:hypothetical protein
MIYRDYHDGDEFVTEKFPMTSPENRKLMEFLDSGGKYDIKSARSDKTYEEALYLGIERAIDELGFRQNQTNILLVVGDCGNDLKDKEVSQQELIDKLVAKDINIMGFQVRRMQHNAFELFNDQIITLMKSSLERKYKALDDKVSVKSAETKDGYKLVNSHSSILYVGSHYYPETGEVMEESKLTSLIEEAVSFCSTSVEHQVDIWARHNTGTGFRTNKTVVNSELDLDQEWLKQRLGDDYERIDQSGGLDPDSGALLPSPFLVRECDDDDDAIRLTVLMLGGGPAIRGITHRIFHKHSVEVVIDEIVNRAIPAVTQLGCSPCTLAIGIGRSQFEATSMMMEAMAKGNYNIQSDFEKTITEKVNQSNVGALGLGGNTSVLATFAKIGPQRASGVRVVALRPCCCFEPRRASVLL